MRKLSFFPLFHHAGTLLPFSLFFLLLTGSARGEFFQRTTCPFTTFIGSVRFPMVVTDNPQIIAYYKGNKIEINEGSYEIKEQRCEHEFYFLFTINHVLPQSTCKEDRNTIGKLVMPKKTPYKCYKITKITNIQAPANQANKSWKVEEVQLRKQANACAIIPENTIIILANPLFIEKLEPEVWKSVNATFKLPTIVFKERLSKTSFDEMKVSAALAALDIDPFHCKPTVVKEVAHNNQFAVLSLPGS